MEIKLWITDVTNTHLAKYKLFRDKNGSLKWAKIRPTCLLTDLPKDEKVIRLPVRVDERLMMPAFITYEESHL